MALHTAHHLEVNLEDTICEHLEKNGWLYSPTDAGYDRKLALFPEDLFAWLEATQPDAYRSIVNPTAPEAAQEAGRKRILRRVVGVLGKPLTQGGGTLNLLRKGFVEGTSTRFRMTVPRPASSLNQKAAEDYAAMRLRVMRQVHFNPAGRESVDLVLLLNGIPVATLELKTDNTQSVGHAKRQYQQRNPAVSPLFGFGTRALVHFAVSNREVHMTTRLEGKATYFLPFNQGDDGRAGNPVNPRGSSTAYLWERVLARDAWLEILAKFVFVEQKRTEDHRGRPTVSTRLIFPRYHQWESVTQILEDARQHGAGQSYLIEHSAGSGKTNTIAWTAHRLLGLHDESDQRIVDSVVVVTDRTVLDDQLRTAILELTQVAGTVVGIERGGSESKSARLKEALLSGGKVIVVTLQTFPAVLELLKNDTTLAGRRYAVIADEAHSSQTGAAAQKLKKVLTPAEAADLEDGGEVATEDILQAEMAGSARPEHVSFLAFTATPKPKTIELFGREVPGQVDGNGHPKMASFHRYTMQQAIEEEFILDVLKNFTNYDTAFELAKKGRDGTFVPAGAGDVVGKGTGKPDDVDLTEAQRRLMRWVRLHPTNISQKVAIIVDHFRQNVAGLLEGQAKAMVVTDSRIAAVKYKRAMDAHIAEHGYPMRTLVAFSGEVKDGELRPETEATMNPHVRGSLARAFKNDEYQVMIVANKFQTGFDEPKLCALYVDKKLAGVLAVQTLSRLNRAMPGKTTTYVLDFVNSEEDILEAFRPYFAGASLNAVTDPNLINDLLTKLDGSQLYTQAEVDAVVEAFVREPRNAREQTKVSERLQALLEPVRRRYWDEVDYAREREDTRRVDELETYRKDMVTLVNMYDFLAQIYPFGDTELLRRAIFFRALNRLLTVTREGEPVDLSEVELVSLTQIRRGTSDLAVDEPCELQPMTGAGTGGACEERRGPLEEAIRALNEAFAAEGIDVRDDQVAGVVTPVAHDLAADQRLRQQAENNTRDQFLESPTLKDRALGALWSNQETAARMHEVLQAGGDTQSHFVEVLGRYVYEAVRAAAGASAQGGVGSVDVAQGGESVEVVRGDAARFPQRRVAGGASQPGAPRTS